MQYVDRLKVIAVVLLLVCGTAGCRMARLPKEVYVDKCKGAWAGQMIGVCYGAPYEFRSVGKIIDGPLNPWKPELVGGAIGQDDCTRHRGLWKSCILTKNK